MSAAAEAADVLIRSIAPAEQIDTASMARTPERMAKALADLCEGYQQTAEEILSTTFAGEGYDQIVVVRSIPFVSLCEHHVLPFTGTVDVAYLPRDTVVGLSKIPRLVRCYSRRLQVQERLTMQIAEAIDTILDPRGVMVVCRGQHSCMRLRGIEAAGEMVTSDVRGLFRENAPARSEALRLLGVGRV